jgi:GrpB-like predicted nucleotidyltransferase (UPF0157 family)
VPELDEPVELVAYDEAWPEVYDQERFRIALAFGVLPKSGLIQHIGSTAVPGLVGKPIIDLMIGSGQWPAPEALVRGICALGYVNLGEAGVPKRIYLRYRGKRNFNVHVVRRGGTHWTNNIALRDYLRGNAAARESYAAAKVAALNIGRGRLLGYSEAKSSVITELISAARHAQR